MVFIISYVIYLLYIRFIICIIRGRSEREGKGERLLPSSQETRIE